MLLKSKDKTLTVKILKPLKKKQSIYDLLKLFKFHRNINWAKENLNNIKKIPTKEINIFARKKKYVSSLNILARLFIKSLSDIYNNSKYDFVQSKLLTVIHKYTGCGIVNIYGTALQDFTVNRIEKLYLRHSAFLSSMMEALLYQGAKARYYEGYRYVYNNQTKKKELKPRYWHRFEDRPEYDEIISHFYTIKPYFRKFMQAFPFYMLKTYRPFLKKLCKLLSYGNVSVEHQYKIVKDAFRYIFAANNGQFNKAFKFYKMLLTNIYKFKLLETCGIKLVIKGRFGKVRKQVQRLIVGSLKLNKLSTQLKYYFDCIVTSKGSYGFHMWFGSNDK